MDPELVAPVVGWLEHENCSVTGEMIVSIAGRIARAFIGGLQGVVWHVGVSVGSAGAAGVGIIILSVVLGSIGIPAAAVALIMGVDRILDMSRTAINVAGDLTACVLMDRWVGGKRSASEQLAEESAREWQRRATGRDALLRPTPPRTVKGSDYI